MKLLSKNIFVRIVALIFTILCIAGLVILRLDNNEKKTKADALRLEVEEMQTYVDGLRADLDRPFDDDYVSEIARNELGLRYPQEIIYYSDAQD